MKESRREEAITTRSFAFQIQQTRGHEVYEQDSFEYGIRMGLHSTWYWEKNTDRIKYLRLDRPELGGGGACSSWRILASGSPPIETDEGFLGASVSCLCKCQLGSDQS